MINVIIEAVSVALNEEFGDIYEIHMEEIKQGLKEPCFFISCINPTNRLLLGNRYSRTNQFCIQYFPKSREKQRECNDIAERMWQCLEYITASGADQPIRGTKMHYEVIDSVLNFFVNYDYFVCRKEQQEQMKQLERNTNVKGGA